MKINDILDQIGSDVLTESTKVSLVEAFDDAVAARVQETLELEVASALQQLDESHTAQLERLLEAIDTDHSNKLKKVIEHIDADHTAKLQQIIKENRRVLEEDAAEFKETLIEQLSNYLDLYIEDAIPADQLLEAVQNKQAARMIESIKQIVAVDDEYITHTIREAVEDGKQQIDKLKEELNSAVKQNIRLSQEAKKIKGDLLIERTTKDFSKEKREYVMRVLKNKDPEYITENLDYVVKMFNREKQANRDELLTEEHRRPSLKTKGATPPPSRIKREVINESARAPKSAVETYLQGLK